MVVDLVGQVHAQKFLLLFLGLHIALNLIERFFWAKVRLIIKFLNNFLGVCSLLLFYDLVPDKVNMISVLLLLARFLSAIHLIHVVHGSVELIFLEFTLLLHSLNLLVKSTNCLLVHIANLVKITNAFVCGMIIDSERTLRSQKLGH